MKRSASFPALGLCSGKLRKDSPDMAGKNFKKERLSKIIWVNRLEWGVKFVTDVLSKIVIQR
ncbi:hypothetical protein D3C71_2092090 [compost metagenome]